MQRLAWLSVGLLGSAWLLASRSSSAEASAGDVARADDDGDAFEWTADELRPAMSAFTGRAAALPAWEQDTILRVARAEGIDPIALAAIRLAENGGPGREFGVLSVPAPTYDDQARVAAVSIRNNLARGGFTRVTDEFWAFMGARWAPVGAANDPTSLNRHWVGNVSTFYAGSALA